MTDPAALPNFGLPPLGVPVSPRTGAPCDGLSGTGCPRADEGGLRERVVGALVGAGRLVEIDADGDVAVSVQGQLVFVRCVDSEPPLMRVFGQWLMDDLPADELARLRAANAVTASVNLVKATVHDDRLVVAVDLLAGDDFHLPSLLDASLDAVLGCVRTWYDTVLELTGQRPM